MDNQEEQEKSKRPSMLDALDDKNKIANRKTFWNRLVVIGKIRNTSKIDLGDYYEKYFKNLQNNPTNPFQEKVTGIIILYPTLMVHIVETSMDVIKILMQDMEAMFKNPTAPLIDAKILNISRDISIRLFPFYTSKIMNFSLEYDSSEPSETVDVLVNETLTRLLRFGKFLNDSAMTQFKKESIDSIHEQHPEFLPNQNYINFLMKNEDLLTPREYLDFLDKPLDITLESELTWPAPFKLFSYQ